jgi:surface antigen
MNSMAIAQTTRIAGVALLSLTLAACAGNPGSKETGGTLIGAALGGLVGSQIGGGSGRLAAVAAGTLLGGFLGNEVGRSLDRADRLRAAQVATSSLEYEPAGATSTWRNPDSGNSGSFTPTRSYQDSVGSYCREYQQTITVGGRTRSAYGTACRQPDGSWRIADSR